MPLLAMVLVRVTLQVEESSQQQRDPAQGGEMQGCGARHQQLPLGIQPWSGYARNQVVVVDQAVVNQLLRACTKVRSPARGAPKV